MKFLLQRVSSASVVIDHTEERSIGKGLLVSVGMSKEDYPNHKETIDKFVRKIADLKLFEDKNEKINASLDDIWWSLLIISNFTLYGRNKKWSQIDFSLAAWFSQAKEMYEYLISALEKTKIPFAQGTFGAYMQVKSVVEGPVNVVLEW